MADTGIGYWKNDVRGAVVYATWKLLQRPGVKLTHMMWNFMDMVAGQQLHLTNPDGSRTFASVYMHENRLLTMEGTVPAAYPEPGLFQQSLGWLDENGRSVRYPFVYYNDPDLMKPAIRQRTPEQRDDGRIDALARPAARHAEVFRPHIMRALSSGPWPAGCWPQGGCMKLGRLGWLAVVGALLAMPLVAQAQEATLTGAVRDNTGGVLPGVTVTATNEAARDHVCGVTDENGVYRIPVRAGVYRINAELAGFTTVVRPGVEFLVGRQATLNLDMTVSGLQETVTVTGEAPLLDTTTSNIGSNIDPRQMQELPLNGRNWMDLTMLAPGQPIERVERGATGPPGLLPGRRGRPAADADGVLRAEPAALQPRLDCRVPHLDQSLRRDPGPDDGHARERGHQVRHEHPVAARSPATSATTA